MHDLTQLTPFERRLGDRLAAELDDAVRPFDPQAIADRAMHGRRALAPRRRLVLLAAAALLLLGGVVAVGSQIIKLPWFLEPPLPWPLAGVLEPTGPLHNASQVPTAVVLADGRVLVTIPWLESTPFNEDAEVWDPTTGQFQIVGPMARHREEPVAVLLRDGRVLLVGSIGAEQTAEVFKPTTGSFVLLASRPSTIHGSAVVLRDGRVLFTGGFETIDPNEGMPTGISSRAEIYNPETDAFSPVGAMQRPRAFHELHLLADGRVLVLGGKLAEAGLGDQPFAEIFDPATNAFEMANRPPFSTDIFEGSARLGDDRLVHLLQPGWAQHPDRSLPMTIRYYDIETGIQTDGPTIPATAPVYDVRTIIALTDNRLLVFGFDKAAHQLLESGEMNRGWVGVLDLHSGLLSEVVRRPASWGTAVALPGGRVLIVGGIEQAECTFQGTTSPCMESTTAVDILR
jgi:hypothetical protein